MKRELDEERERESVEAAFHTRKRNAVRTTRLKYCLRSKELTATSSKIRKEGEKKEKRENRMQYIFIRNNEEGQGKAD